MSYNPSRPRALGLEWFPDVIGQSPMQGDADQFTIHVKSSTTETIDHLRVGHFWSGAVNAHRRLWADVYPINTFGGADEEIVNSFVPNETTAFGTPSTVNGWEMTNNNGAVFFNGGTGSHTALDDTDPNSWLRLQSFNTQYPDAETVAALRHLGLRFTSGAMPTGRRILAVYFDYAGKRPAMSRVQIIGRLDLYKSGNYVGTFNNNVNFPGSISTPPGWPVTTFGPFYINPETQLPWSLADIQAFDTTYEVRLVLFLTGLFLNNVTMRVVSIPERRVAWGWGDAVGTKSDGSAFGPNDLRSDVIVNLQNNDTPGTNWSKVSGTEYAVMFRRLPYFDVTGQGVTTGLPSMRWIGTRGGIVAHEDGQVFSAHATADGRLRELNGLLAIAAPLWLVRTDSAMSADSSPYHSVDFISVNSSTGFVARQVVTPDDNRTYSHIRATVGYNAGQDPTQPLQVRLIRISDSNVMGAPGSIDIDDFVLLPQRTWVNENFPNARFAEAVFELATPATLSSGVNYYIEFLSTTSPSAPWLVMSLRAENPTGVTGDVSAPGNGTVAATGSGDLSAIALDRPAPPGTITTTLDPETVTAPSGLLCDVGTLPAVDVAWSATALGSLFSHYEIERNDDGEWVLVRKVTAESTVTWTDREMLANVPVQYRVRVVRNDGGRSAAAVAAAVTPVQNPTVVRLASNAKQTQLAVVKIGTTYDYAFPTASRAVLAELYNRDFSVILRETEKAGASFPLPVLIWGDSDNNPPAGRGMRAFGPLRALLEDHTLPYVAVITDDGDRVFGHVHLPNGASRNRQAKLYLATLGVTQTTATPAVVE